MISCEICNKVLASFKKLSKHCRKKHPELPIIQCCFCDFLTTEDLLFRKHKTEYHPMERLGCEYCEFTSRHWRRIKKHHTRIHFTSNETICNSTQIDNSTGIEELKSTQPEEKENFVADTEVKTEPNVGFLKSERKLNSGIQGDKSTFKPKKCCEGLNSCNLCTLDVVNNGDGTQQTSFVCDVCKKMFESESHLSCHQVIHTAVQFYICSLCDRDFVNAEVYASHLKKRHFVPKPFKCLFCDKSFTSKNTLSLHRRSHVKDLIHKCDKCNYQTHVTSNMRRHQRYHSNMRPFVCINCDYSSLTKSDLDIHVRIHTGEKPFCCNICYKRFTQHITLKRHKQSIHLLQ